MTRTCRVCGREFTHDTRGRPFTRCAVHRIVARPDVPVGPEPEWVSALREAIR